MVKNPTELLIRELNNVIMMFKEAREPTTQAALIGVKRALDEYFCTVATKKPRKGKEIV